MLPREGWALILCYLNYCDLMNVSACSKMFDFLSRKIEKFVRQLNCSRLIVSNKDMFCEYYDLWLSFVLKSERIF